MKKLINRFLGVVVAAALLMGSVMPNVAVMAAGSHETDEEVPKDQKGECEYTITLTKPDGDVEIDITKASYGAYQIFSGKVPDVKTTPAHENPGNDNEKLSITDIKWGNAFGKVGSEEWRKKIVSFAIALGNVRKNANIYNYAFAEFNSFEWDNSDGTPLVDETGNLNSDYVEGGVTITATSADDDLKKVKYDKLAVAVAEEIEKHTDREWLQAFSDILGGYTKTGTESYVKYYYSGSWSSDEEYEIKVPAGYYMIIDRSNISTSERDEAYSARMLFVADNIKQVLKEDVPTLDKKIQRANDNKYYSTEVAGVGDVVDFRLTGTLPNNYDNYLGGYQYIFKDTLSNGLTLEKNSVTVTATGVFQWDETGKNWEWKPEVTVTIPEKYDATAAEGTTIAPHTHHLGTLLDNKNYICDCEDHSLAVKFPCLKEMVFVYEGNRYLLGYNGEDGKDGDTVTSFGSSRIYVDYSATVNSAAIISNGNINEAQIEYSDDPQAYDNTDNTTPKQAKVYTFGLKIVKIDAAKFLKDESTAELNGAKFTLVRKKAESVNNEYEIANFTPLMGPTGTLFEGGQYRSISEWKDLGEADDNAALQTQIDGFLTKQGTDADNYRVVSDSSGKINISGLDAGVEYTMVETETPDDKYAKINPFTITLSAAKNGDEYTGKLESAKVSNTVGEGESFSYTEYVQLLDPNGTGHEDTDGSANMLVANFKYVDLPSTGGIGIYPFYIIGGIVVAGSIILFALSRREKTA